MKAKIDNRSCEVEMISKDGNRVEISVDGKIYDIDVVMSESGFCSILHEGRSYNAEAVRHSEGKYTITTNFRYFDIELSNPQKNEIFKRATIGNGRSTGDNYLSYAGQDHKNNGFRKQGSKTG